MNSIKIDRETFCAFVTGISEDATRELLWRYVRFDHKLSSLLLHRATNKLFDRLAAGEVEWLSNPKRTVEQAVLAEVYDYLKGEIPELVLE